MTVIEKLIEQTEAALGDAERRRAEAERALKDARDDVKQIRESLRSLERQLRERNRRRPPRTAAAQAGPRAVEAVSDLLRDGPTTQREIVERLPFHEGTISYALRALREAGAVEATGYVVDGSREYRFVRGRVGVARALYDRAREVREQTARARV